MAEYNNKEINYENLNKIISNSISTIDSADYKKYDSSDIEEINLTATEKIDSNSTGYSINIGSDEITITYPPEYNKILFTSAEKEIGNTISDYPDFAGEWCAQFVSYILKKNGYKVDWATVAGEDYKEIFYNLRKSGGEVHLDLASKYRKNVVNKEKDEYDPNYVPQPGDVVLFDWIEDDGTPDGVCDHVGFVVCDNGDGTVTTIEGNTSGDAGPSCVAKKTRRKEEIYGYCTPKKQEKTNK